MMQYTLIGYAIASAIILLLCGLAYKLLLDSKVSPSFNRLMVMLIIATAVILPLMVSLVPQPAVQPVIELEGLTVVGFASDVPEISPEPFKLTFQDFSKIVSWIYYAGLIAMLGMTLLTVCRLILLMKKSKVVEINGQEVYLHNNKEMSSFSWNNRIFLYVDSLGSDEEDLKMLLSHEMAHVDRWHWLDLVVAQMMLIFQWFNPAAWYFRNELQRIHEYEADETVLNSGIDEKRYQILLLKNISRNRFSGLTDGLNNCSLKKRIIMMKKTNFKENRLLREMGVVGFALVGGIIIHLPAVASVLEENLNSDSKTLKNSMIINKENENVKAVPVVYHVDGIETPEEEALSISSGNIESITINKDEEQPKVEITTKETRQPVEYNGTASYEKDPKEKGYLKNYPDAYLSTEKIAEYKGGQSQLMMDLSKSIVYPQEAMHQDIQGRVVVRFQINPDGSVSDCEVVRSPNPILNEAAIKAVEATSGNWIPGENDGKPVASVFNLPVTFSLSYPKEEASK